MKKYILFLHFLILPLILQAANYGSNSSVSLLGPLTGATAIAGPTNTILTFGYADQGFTFQDSSVTCTFKSIFPVSDVINLNNRTLYLDRDLVMADDGVTAQGTIWGCGHTYEGSKVKKTLNFPTGGSTYALNLMARAIETRAMYSTDWNYDSTYLANVVATGTGNDLNIYSFNGIDLTKVTGANLGTTGYSVRWHPSANYLAVGTGNSIIVYQFEPSTNTLTSLQTISATGRVNGVAWQGRGDYLAVAKYNDTPNIYVYQFNQAGPTYLTAKANCTLQPSRIIGVDTVCWAPAGNNNYIALGTNTATGAPDEELCLLYYNDTSLTVTKSVAINQTINTLDWSPTGTYIAIGLDGGTDRFALYQHTAWNDTILSFTTSITESLSVNSVSWKPTGDFITIGLASSSNESNFRLYSFNNNTKALTIQAPIYSTSAINAVSFSPNGTYIARADATTKYFSIYKPLPASFTFKDTTIILNADITVESPFTFQGNCTLNGRGNNLIFQGNGGINIKTGTSATCKDVTLRFQNPGAFALESSTSKLKFEDTTLWLNSDVVFGDGSFEVEGDVHITGTHTFAYTSEYTSTIKAYSSLTLGEGSCLQLGNKHCKQPLEIDNNSAFLILNGATIKITDLGANLIHGLVCIHGKSTFDISSTHTELGLKVGDGISANDPLISIQQGSELNIKNGAFTMNTNAPDRLIFDGASSILSLDSTSSFYIERPVFFESGYFQPSPHAGFSIASDSYLTTSDTRMRNSETKEDLYLTGTIDSLNRLKLDGYGDKIILTMADLIKDVSVSGVNNSIIGAGNLYGSIILQDNTTTLTIGVNTPFNGEDFIANGGKIYLTNNLDFIGNKTITGESHLYLDQHKISLGTDELTITDTWHWHSSSGAELNATINLASNWEVGGILNLNGNGNIINLLHGGKFTIRPNSTLLLTNAVLKGLGHNDDNGIIFMDDTAELRLSKSYIELERSISTTIGGIYVDGPTTLGLKNYDWTFDQKASLTVDGVTLLVDPLDKINYGKIKFGNTQANYLTLINSGTIKTMADLNMISTTDLASQIRVNSNAFIDFAKNTAGIQYLRISADWTLKYDIFLNKAHKLYVDASCTLIGDGKTIHLDRDRTTARPTIIDVADGVTLTLSNVTIDNMDDTAFNLGTNASVHFGDNTILALGDNTYLETDWIFTGSGIIDGQGKDIMLYDSTDAKTPHTITVQNRKFLKVRNANLFYLRDQNLRCADDYGTISLENAWLALDITHPFQFGLGAIQIWDDVRITGTGGIFGYTSRQPLYIYDGSMLTLDNDVTFSYAPKSNNRDRIVMEDMSSILYANNCSLISTNTGLRLTKGTLLLDGKVTFSNSTPTSDSVRSLSESIAFGNGTLIDNLNIEIMPGASINLQKGILSYDNVDTGV